jgi:prepilin-type N-terminal cleavage/methylation domain-containing protein
MKKSFNKGFTLIELLVVIAIIGILASVILASLNTARAKGADAAVKSDLANSRAQAELFYGSQTPNGYAGVCSTAATANGILAMIQDAASKSGTTYTAATAPASPSGVSSATTTVCHDSAGAWAAAVPMKSVGTTTAPIYFCVDSTGASKQGTASVTEALTTATQVACS